MDRRLRALGVEARRRFGVGGSDISAERANRSKQVKPRVATPQGLGLDLLVSLKMFFS